MKHYLLSVYQPEGPKPEPAALQKIMQHVEAFNNELKAAGVWVFSDGLNSQSTATVLREQSGEIVMTDGPFAEVKEYLGGLTIIKAADLDAARGVRPGPPPRRYRPRRGGSTGCVRGCRTTLAGLWRTTAPSRLDYQHRAPSRHRPPTA